MTQPQQTSITHISSHLRTITIYEKVDKVERIIPQKGTIRTY